jgi:hypothetical protein
VNKDYFLKKLSINRPSVFESYNYDHLPAIFLAHDVVPIECYQHGLFYQKAYGHMQGSGCQICGQLTASNARALTTDEFIAKSTKRFGERFDYEKTVYVRREVALTLTCRRHGDIELTPLQHDWSKHGCAQCDVEVPKLIRMRKVLDKAKKIHGDKYDYSRVTFANVNDKMEIVCPHHGAFWQSLYDHTGKGAGCPHCARENDKLTIDSFVTKARAIHGNQYGYSQVKYETNASMVTITCPKHGDFIQRAASHLAGSKCKACHVELARLPAEEFIKNAKAVHGTTYDYSKVNYHGNKTPVEIICSIHGSFWQKPNSHVASKCGCRSCSESNGEKAVESFLKKYGINRTATEQTFTCQSLILTLSSMDFSIINP